MKKKELVVSAIKNGTVIDHIPSDKLFQVVRILDLEHNDCQMLFGTNLSSQKLGKKAIIKIQDKFFETNDINKIALVCPTATLTIIRDYEVVEKRRVTIPSEFEGIVKCFNPKCITNHEHVTPKFRVLDANEIKLQCKYCQKITKEETISFL